MTKRNAIILAAGKGTRMRSKLYKVLHQVCGKTMVEHVLTQLEKAKIDNIITIVGFGAETVEQRLGHRTKYALQEQQLGTGHAVMQTKNLLANEDGETIIVSGDTPLFTAETFEKLFEYHEQRHAAATILLLLLLIQLVMVELFEMMLESLNELWNKKMLLFKSRQLRKLILEFTALITKNYLLPLVRSRMIMLRVSII